jgi:predicted Zn-dependent protease
MDAARYGLALSLSRTGQLEEARQTLQSLLNKAPDDIAYNLALIEIDATANRLDAAQQRLTRLLALYPNNYPLLQEQSELFLKQGQPRQAEAVLDQLLKTRPKDPDVWYQVSEVRGLAGNIVGLHQARAEFFALVGDYDQALEQLDYAKRRVSNNFPLTARIDARQSDLRNEQRLLKEMLR